MEKTVKNHRSSDFSLIPALNNLLLSYISFLMSLAYTCKWKAALAFSRVFSSLLLTCRAVKQSRRNINLALRFFQRCKRSPKHRWKFAFRQLDGEKIKVEPRSSICHGGEISPVLVKRTTADTKQIREHRDLSHITGPPLTLKGHSRDLMD